MDPLYSPSAAPHIFWQDEHPYSYPEWFDSCPLLTFNSCPLVTLSLIHFQSATGVCLPALTAPTGEGRFLVVSSWVFLGPSSSEATKKLAGSGLPALTAASQSPRTGGGVMCTSVTLAWNSEHFLFKGYYKGDQQNEFYVLAFTENGSVCAIHHFSKGTRIPKPKTGRLVSILKDWKSHSFLPPPSLIEWSLTNNIVYL